MSDWPIIAQDELIFWGVHPFRESPYTMACTLCGWDYNSEVHSERD